MIYLFSDWIYLVFDWKQLESVVQVVPSVGRRYDCDGSRPTVSQAAEADGRRERGGHADRGSTVSHI